MTIKGIIFDLNNVIEDYTDYKKNVLEVCKNTIGRCDIFRDKDKVFKIFKHILEDFRCNIGFAPFEHHYLIWDRLLKRINSFTIENLNLVYANYVDEYVKVIKMYDDVQPCLDALSKSFMLGIVSNGNYERIYRFIEKNKLDKYFTSIIISEEMGLQKPHPFLFRACIMEMGLKQNECMMVGDRFDTDIKGAKHLGMFAIRIKRGQYAGQSATSILEIPDKEIVTLKEMTSPNFFNPINNVYLPKTGAIVCGGKGSRMGEDYQGFPKVLVPIKGVPILHYSIKALSRFGCSKIFLVTSDYTDKKIRADTIANNENVIIVNANASGTGKALLALERQINEPFFYLNGDVIYRPGLLHNIACYHNYSNLATISVSRNSLAPTHPHIKICDSIMAAMEFPPPGGHPNYPLCSMEAALFSEAIFSYLYKIQDSDMTMEAVLLGHEEGKTCSVFIDPSPWFHLMTHEDLLRIPIDLLDDYGKMNGGTNSGSNSKH